MKNYICKTCGVQYTASDKAPEHCYICEDERQYINWEGQQWTHLDELNSAYNNIFKEEEEKVTSIVTKPKFAIGQRAFLIQTEQGNVLWDCISNIEDSTIEKIKKRGGLSAIAISHPHFYSSMVEWSIAFGNIPIYLHSDDSEWIQRSHPNIVLWKGENLKINDETTIIRCGGHFAGSSVLHWKGNNNAGGVLFTADTINVVSDRNFVTFMYSYPNLIPLSQNAVDKIVTSVELYDFDRIYGGWTGYNIYEKAKVKVKHSAERYKKFIS